jgi:hypothetical protein
MRAYFLKKKTWAKESSDMKTLRTGRQLPEEEIIQIQKALDLKKLRGSIIYELVRCGKESCSVCSGGFLHGPYPYLHFWDSESQTVKRKYLSQAAANLLIFSTEELEQKLKACPKTVIRGEGGPEK